MDQVAMLESLAVLPEPPLVVVALRVAAKRLPLAMVSQLLLVRSEATVGRVKLSDSGMVDVVRYMRLSACSHSKVALNSLATIPLHNKQRLLHLHHPTLNYAPGVRKEAQSQRS